MKKVNIDRFFLESRISKLSTKQKVGVVTEMLVTISLPINRKSLIQAEEKLPQIIFSNNIAQKHLFMKENVLSSSHFGKIKEKT